MPHTRSRPTPTTSSGPVPAVDSPSRSRTPASAVAASIRQILQRGSSDAAIREDLAHLARSVGHRSPASIERYASRLVEEMQIERRRAWAASPLARSAETPRSPLGSGGR